MCIGGISTVSTKVALSSHEQKIPITPPSTYLLWAPPYFSSSLGITLGFSSPFALVIHSHQWNETIWWLSFSFFLLSLSRTTSNSTHFIPNSPISFFNNRVIITVLDTLLNFFALLNSLSWLLTDGFIGAQLLYIVLVSTLLGGFGSTSYLSI